VSSKIIFVDKVAGVPVSATVDNNCENMLYQVQCLLPKSDPPLHLASRLDVCTSGVGQNCYLKLDCYRFKVTFASLFIIPTHLELSTLSSSLLFIARILSLASFLTFILLCSRNFYLPSRNCSSSNRRGHGCCAKQSNR
jgi:hypothetical protein